jgi:hypothetical protein
MNFGKAIVLSFVLFALFIGVLVTVWSSYFTRAVFIGSRKPQSLESDC